MNTYFAQYTGNHGEEFTASAEASKFNENTAEYLKGYLQDITGEDDISYKNIQFYRAIPILVSVETKITIAE